MIRRYVVLGVVWVGCTAAWMLLGATLLVRSGETSSALVNEVHQLWGPQLDQAAPSGQYTEQRPREERRTLYDASGRPYETSVRKMEDVSFPLPLVSTRARVSLALEHRQKGLLWFPTYAADFEGRYVLLNDTAVTRSVTVSFALPAQGAIYDGFEVLDEKGQLIGAEVDGGSAHWVVSLAPSARHTFQVRYRPPRAGRSRTRFRASGSEPGTCDAWRERATPPSAPTHRPPRRRWAAPSRRGPRSHRRWRPGPEARSSRSRSG